MQAYDFENESLKFILRLEEENSLEKFSLKVYNSLNYAKKKNYLFDRLRRRYHQDSRIKIHYTKRCSISYPNFDKKIKNKDRNMYSLYKNEFYKDNDFFSMGEHQNQNLLRPIGKHYFVEFEGNMIKCITKTKEDSSYYSIKFFDQDILIRKEDLYSYLIDSENEYGYINMFCKKFKDDILSYMSFVKNNFWDVCDDVISYMNSYIKKLLEENSMIVPHIRKQKNLEIFIITNHFDLYISKDQQFLSFRDRISSLKFINIPVCIIENIRNRFMYNNT